MLALDGLVSRLCSSRYRTFSTGISPAMQRQMSVTFLGTSSGGGPSESRNCSSLVANIVGDGSLWMVDCAEGTTRQFALQPHGQRYLKANKVTKIFITHMHADHIMGIVPFLRNVLFPPPTGPSSDLPQPPKLPRVEIYGPAGLRTFVRSIMQMTLTKTADNYVVHELLTPTDPVTPCDPPEVMHCSECIGTDFMCSETDGLWKEFTREDSRFGDLVVDAGPINHRDPCLGYVFRELYALQRKIVILGDTYDPSAIVPLATNPSPSLLIHEATDAYIPRLIDPKATRLPEVVTEKALSRGHSTPQMAGEFARKVGANRLILNHIGGRFPAPRVDNYGYGRDRRSAVIGEIERQATLAWVGPHDPRNAIAAFDYLHFVIPETVVSPPRDFQEVRERSADPDEDYGRRKRRR